MILEIRNDGVNQYGVLVGDYSSDPMSMIFASSGQAKTWQEPPKVMPSQNKKKPIRADISHLWPGSIVLNRRAYNALHQYLLPFGQLLELDCLGETEYFYNVTNLLNCIDKDKSEFHENGSVKKEVFYPKFDGSEPLIFKAPETARTRIYINQIAREQIVKIINAESLTGITFCEAGSLAA